MHIQHHVFLLACTVTLFTGSVLGQSAGPGRYQDSSGPRDSGECANFSEWHVLSTRPIEGSYKIKNFQYQLRGDRSCGAWAECEVIADTPAHKSVRFRMQGHSEYCGIFKSIGHPNNGIAQSEMIFSYDIE